jgi:hypothetical protein
VSHSRCRLALGWILALLLPLAGRADDKPSAMLYANGTTWVNGEEVPKCVALFAGDMVQTHANATATVNAADLNVMVLGDSLIKYEGSSVELDHGAVRIATGRQFATHVGVLTVRPASDSWTVFQVIDVDGRVQIESSHGSLVVTDGQMSTTLQPGQQTSRTNPSVTESKKKARRKSGAVPAMKGGVMSSTPAVYSAAGVAAAVATWVYYQKDEPVSPATPSRDQR